MTMEDNLYEKNSLKEEILKKSWELFREKGYNNTTLSEIIKAANTSKGGFYYYFTAKDELLNELYVLFDQKYEIYNRELDENLNEYEKIIELNRRIFAFTEDEVSIDLLSELYRSQLSRSTRVEEHFFNQYRYYYKLLRKLILAGQDKKIITLDYSQDEIAEHVLTIERGIMYSWCAKKGRFSLKSEGAKSFALYFSCFKA